MCNAFGFLSVVLFPIKNFIVLLSMLFGFAEVVQWWSDNDVPTTVREGYVTG